MIWVFLESGTLINLNNVDRIEKNNLFMTKYNYYCEITDNDYNLIKNILRGIN